MSRTRSVTEERCITRTARLARNVAALATADRKSEQAAHHLDAMRAEAVKAIVDAMPLLTAEQREQLRPLLAGTIPAERSAAAESAA